MTESNKGITNSSTDTGTRRESSDGKPKGFWERLKENISRNIHNKKKEYEHRKHHTKKGSKKSFDNDGKIISIEGGEEKPSDFIEKLKYRLKRHHQLKADLYSGKISLEEYIKRFSENTREDACQDNVLSGVQAYFDGFFDGIEETLKPRSKDRNNTEQNKMVKQSTLNRDR